MRSGQSPARTKQGFSETRSRTLPTVPTARVLLCSELFSKTRLISIIPQSPGPDHCLPQAPGSRGRTGAGALSTGSQRETFVAQHVLTFSPKKWGGRGETWEQSPYRTLGCFPAHQTIHMWRRGTWPLKKFSKNLHQSEAMGRKICSPGGRRPWKPASGPLFLLSWAQLSRTDPQDAEITPWFVGWGTGPPCCTSAGWRLWVHLGPPDVPPQPLSFMQAQPAPRGGAGPALCGLPVPAHRG